MSKIQITVEPGKEDNSAEIILEGEFTIFSLEEIIPDLGNITDKYTNFNFKLNVTNDIDLSGVQLVYSVMRKLEENNKTYNFTYNFPEETITLLSNNGFNDLLK